MKKIVIIGSSAVGGKIIEEIRTNDSSSEISLITFDGQYPYKRDAFAPFIANDIASDHVFYRTKDFYAQNLVNVILDEKISRINVKRKKVFMDNSKHIDYEILFITDLPENRFPPIKGTNKTGVFGYKKLKDIHTILNGLPLTDTIAIQTESFSGLQAAVAFKKRN